MQFCLYYDKLIHSNVITNIGAELTKIGTRTKMMIITTTLYRENTFQTIAGTRIQYKTTFIDQFGSTVLFDLYSIYYLEQGSIHVTGISETQTVVVGTGIYLNTTGKIDIESDSQGQLIQFHVNMLETGINR
jgi:hypothetical protein